MAEEPEDFSEFLKRRESASNDYINGNAEGLLELSTTHDPATFFPPNGDCIEKASKVNAANKKGGEAFGTGSKGRFEILQSGFSGDLGFWTGIHHADVKMKGKDETVPMQLRTTEVFRREHGTWKLMHRHADMARTELAQTGKTGKK